MIRIFLLLSFLTGCAQQQQQACKLTEYAVTAGINTQYFIQKGGDKNLLGR